DFSDLQLNSGFVNSLFRSKPTFVEQEIKELDALINNISEDIELLKKEKIESVNELDALFILENIDEKNYRESINSSFNSRVELIKAIKKDETKYRIIRRQNSYPNYNTKNIIISKVLDKLSDNQEYVERKKVIERKSRGEIDKLNREKEKLVNKKIILKSDKLQNI